jgi:hypothetical protein
MSAGQAALAAGVAQERPRRFALVSALIGAGYGAVFALAPIVCSVVWGVENFGTNWGLLAVVPAFGATAWGLVYSAVYQAGASAAAASSLLLSSHPSTSAPPSSFSSFSSSAFFSTFSSTFFFFSSSSPSSAPSFPSVALPSALPYRHYNNIMNHLSSPSPLPAAAASDALCFGQACYASTFWAMAVSVWLACAAWLWAWKGPGGWARRGILV